MEPIRPPLNTPHGRARRFTNYNRAMTPRNNYFQYSNPTPTINIYYPPNYGYFRPQIVVANPYFNYQPYRYQIMPPPNYYLLNQGFSPYVLPSINQIKPPQQKKSPKNKKRTKSDESDSSDSSSSYESSSYNSSSSTESQSTLSTTSSSSRLSEYSSSSSTKSSSSYSITTSSSTILPHLKKTTTKTESDTESEIIESSSTSSSSNLTTSSSFSNDDRSIHASSSKPPSHPRARIAIKRNSDRKSSADRKSDSDSETDTLKSIRRLADQGDTDALFRLGRFYMRGEGGVEEDPPKAFRYFQQAAEQGHAEAQLYSGILLMMGDDGIEEDREKGREWLEKAAAQGNSDALELLESGSMSMYSSSLSSGLDEHVKLSSLFGGSDSESYSESETSFTFL